MTHPSSSGNVGQKRRFQYQAAAKAATVKADDKPAQPADDAGTNEIAGGDAAPVLTGAAFGAGADGSVKIQAAGEAVGPEMAAVADSAVAVASAAPAAAVPDGYLRDPRGRLVPAALVKPEQLAEDALVRELHGRAILLSEQLRKFREAAFADIEALLELLAEKYGVTLGGGRGNLTLDTFDGELLVLVSVGDQLDFGPELQIAKQLIDGCIHRWSEGASVNLQAIVNDAFDVDKKGKLNVGRILALRRINIVEADWLKAMDAISAATRVVRSKRYLRLYRKRGDLEKEQVPLDLASV